MALIALSGARKAFGGFRALDEVTFTVGASEKVALVGPNGSGKTTILRLITGSESPDSGSVTVLPGVTLGYMPQDSELVGRGQLLDEVSNASSEVKHLEESLRRLEDQIAGSPTDGVEGLLEQYAAVQHEFERLGGYAFDAEVKAVLSGLGLGPEHWEKPVEVLSGGQKTRAALAKLLLQKPDALLLDEPTNHLDIDACEWLEEFLAGFPGAALVVSHDRFFLDKVVTKVVDLHEGFTRTYPGNYTAYARQRQEFLRQSMESYERQQEEIERIEDFIRRYKAGQRSKQARGREKLLSRMERLARPKTETRKMGLSLEQAAHSGHVVLDIRDGAKSFGEAKLFSGLDLLVTNGDRLGLIGPNGSGKTTLLKIIIGLESLSAGSVALGYNVEAAYFAQDLSTLEGDGTVLDELLDTADLTPPEARHLLARFLFVGDDVFKAVSALSGGERNRLALAKLMVSKANLLILDEPTNHLDIDSREALGEALQGFAGTIILTSHDRYLLNSLATRVVSIDGGSARVFDGNYNYYLQHSRREPRQITRKRKKAQPTRSGQKRPKGPSPARLEEEIAKLEGRKREVEEMLSDPTLYADHERSAEALAEHGDLAAKIDALYDDLEEALDAEQAGHG